MAILNRIGTELLLTRKEDDMEKAVYLRPCWIWLAYRNESYLVGGCYKTENQVYDYMPHTFYTRCGERSPLLVDDVHRDGSYPTLWRFLVIHCGMSKELVIPFTKHFIGGLIKEAADMQRTTIKSLKIAPPFDTIIVPTTKRLTAPFRKLKPCFAGIA